MKLKFTNTIVFFKKQLVSISQFVSATMTKNGYPTLFGNGLKTLLVCLACWLMPSIAKADSPVPTSVVSSYNAALQRFTITVNWYWTTTSSSKHIGAAAFVDLNGDGITPTVYDNPATYTSGGNPFPAGLQARDEFLGQIALSNIEGSAFSSRYAGSDNTDNGIASGVSGVTPASARMLLPYLGHSMEEVNTTTGTFTLVYNNVPVPPTRLCLVLYDPHSPFNATSGHSVISAGPDHNTDNSLEKGSSSGGTVSCGGLVDLRCAANHTEAGCQSQSAINAAYATWLASAVGSGCNGVLTNNSTGAPSASGGSKTVTFTYTQNGCDNQAAVTTCTATFTVSTCTTPNVYNPDSNYTTVNVPVSGNVQTNDVVPAGTVYGTPVPLGGNPPSGSITMNSNGTYSFVSPNVGVYRYNVPVCVPGQAAPCPTTLLTITVTGPTPSPVYNPDINVTYVNVPVPGNVQTNDVVPSGTTYGTPAPLAGNPQGGNITMNSNGTYSFVSPNVGVYRYIVPVCVPGQAAPCPTTLLTITVLGPHSNNNPPVANTDIATTGPNTPVTLKSLANDYAGNPGGLLNPSTLVVTINPRYGTYTVNNTNGDITYTPAAGFSGNDTLTYRVCDNSTPTALCATAIQIITVKPAGAPNTTAAADDYVSTPVNTVVTGNAMTNDTDPEGNSQSITAQTTTIAGKGTLVLNSNGTFTFSPVSGFSGPVNFPYTTTDNGTPAASANATIYILVSPARPATNPDFNSTFVNVPVPGNVSTNDRVPAGSSYGTSPTLVSGPAGSSPSIAMNANGTYTFVTNVKGVYVYDVPVCMPGQTAPCAPTKLTITVLDAAVVSNSPVANVDIAITRINTPVTLMSLANDAAGNTGNSLVPSSVTIITAPLHGTATVNTATGDITYTPATGFTGTDTLRYQVCDDQVPSKCASANQIITVRPNNSPNTTEAADDYKITAINTVATGNVKVNDNDPEGNIQSVTAQNTTIAGKGNLVLNTNGDYTFTPVTGFTGPVDFPYTTCDNGFPQACAMATLHILVRPLTPVPDLTPNITVMPNIILDTMNFNVIVRVQELDGAPTNGSEILVRIIKDSRVTFTYNPALTNVGFSAVQNNVWTYDGSDPFFHIFRTNTIIAANGSSTFGFVANFNPGGKSRGKYTMTASLNSGSGGETKTNNNQDAEVVDYLYR